MKNKYPLLLEFPPPPHTLHVLIAGESLPNPFFFNSQEEHVLCLQQYTFNEHSVNCNGTIINTKEKYTSNKWCSYTSSLAIE